MTAWERHDPEEDARIAMALYQQVVRPKLITDYDTLVKLLTQRQMRQLGQLREHKADAISEAGYSG